jgi:hypothetical protein
MLVSTSESGGDRSGSRDGGVVVGSGAGGNWWVE